MTQTAQEIVAPASNQAVQISTYADGLLSVIERAARDPSVDIDKMERLIEMQERVQRRNAEIAFNAALSDMQPNLPVVDERGGIKGRDGKVQSTYALWEDINEAIKPHLAAHGFGLRFRVERDGDNISVTGILSHRDGHKEETTLTLPSDTSGSKNAVQSIGSSTSYGKRYTAAALLNITTTGEDDDGNKAGALHAISVTQYNSLLSEIARVGSNNDAFAAYLKSQKKLATDDLSDLPVQHFEFAMTALKQKEIRDAG